MKTRTLVLALLLSTTALALAPAADARQVCTYGTGDPCDEYLVCVYNNWDLDPYWVCHGRVDPCLFRCWLP